MTNYFTQNELKLLSVEAIRAEYSRPKEIFLPEECTFERTKVIDAVAGVRLFVGKMLIRAVSTRFFTVGIKFWYEHEDIYHCAILVERRYIKYHEQPKASSEYEAILLPLFRLSSEDFNKLRKEAIND